MELPENVWGKKRFSLIDRCPENTNQFLAPVSHVSPEPLLLSQSGNKDVWLRLWNWFFQWKFMPRLEIPKWYNICHYIQIVLFVCLRSHHYSFHQSEGSEVQECDLNNSFIWNKTGTHWHVVAPFWQKTNWKPNIFSLKSQYHIYFPILQCLMHAQEEMLHVN